jgi:hypothetical protein
MTPLWRRIIGGDQTRWRVAVWIRRLIVLALVVQFAGGSADLHAQAPPGTFALASTSAAPGATVTLMSLDPCPMAARAYVDIYSGPLYGGVESVVASARPDGAGHWEAVLQADTRDVYSLYAICGGSTTYRYERRMLIVAPGVIPSKFPDAVVAIAGGHGLAIEHPPGPVPDPPWAVQGFWTVAANGSVTSHNNVQYNGVSPTPVQINEPIVGLAPTPTDAGLWLVASDGGVFSFGDARFLGSTGATRLNRPVVGIAATPTGKGYWLVASDGGIFSFGDAPYLGSSASRTSSRPFTGIAATHTGDGYWLVAASGIVLPFGDARYFI